MKTFFLILSLSTCFIARAWAQRPPSDLIPAEKDSIKVQPIRHGTLILAWAGNTIYVDPVQREEVFEGLSAPDIILVTDVHGDHLSIEAIRRIITPHTQIVAPPAVTDRLSEAEFKHHILTVANGGRILTNGISIRAIPMYNIPSSGQARHPKGRGNGYVINLGGKKVYISGDTEDIQEMRALKGIDVAFLCMNMPYTMDVSQAASAVLDFKPAIVYPYHYRGSDIEKFEALVQAGSDTIEVRLRDWYPGRESE